MDFSIINIDDSLWLETLQKIRHDIYHLPQYVKLEANRLQANPEAISIREGDRVFFLPYLWRSANNLFDGKVTADIIDVISPYGYPGFLLSEAAEDSPDFLNSAIDKLIQVWREKGVCSAFLRLHTILNQNISSLEDREFFKLNGETVSIDLTLDKETILQHTRSEHRNKINRAKRQGFVAKIVPFEENLDRFIAIYEETMDRVNATQQYYFGETYFKDLAAGLGDKLHLCVVEFEEQIACAGLFTECCGIIQYHLAGTSSQFLKQAPSKLMFDYMRFWAKERGNEVCHLGGGLGGAQDNLYHFKAGFSKQRHRFVTFRIVTDPTRYAELVEWRAQSLQLPAEKLMDTGFFPAYRSLG